MKIFKISNMSIPGALILSALIIGISIFLTTLVFFGGDGNRQKLFIKSPTMQKNTPPTLSPEQIKKLQEQRAAQMNKTAPATTTTTQ
jgi:hypothetical protein